MQLAEQDALVTFGIPPTYAGNRLRLHRARRGHRRAQQASRSARFTEKPLLEVAQEMLKSGRYYWNSGMFCFRAAGLPRRDGTACARHLCKAQPNAGRGMRSRTIAPICRRRSLPRCRDISIDYAVMEKSARVAVVPASFGWSDVGSWKAVSELVDADASGNRAQGECVFIDSSNCYVQSSGRLVAAVGVDGLMVVDTPDALLVAHQDHVQDVKKVAQQLKLANHETYKIHRTVLRPWGSYTVLEEGPGFKIKRIVVKPGASLSLQMHYHRSEHWVVVSGTAMVTNGEKRDARAHQRIHLHSRRPSAPPGESGQARSGDDRGAERELSRRRRHRAVRGPLRPRMTGDPALGQIFSDSRGTIPRIARFRSSNGVLGEKPTASRRSSTSA